MGATLWVNSAVRIERRVDVETHQAQHLDHQSQKANHLGGKHGLSNIRENPYARRK